MTHVDPHSPDAFPLARVEGRLNPEQLNELRVALGSLSFADSLTLQLNPDKEQPAVTEEGFRQDMLEFVEPDAEKGLEGGWFVSWHSFRDFAIKDYPLGSGKYNPHTARRNSMSQKAGAIYKKLAASLEQQLRSEDEAGQPNGLLGRTRTGQMDQYNLHYTEALIDPASLVNAVAIHDAASRTIGAASREVANFELLRNFVAALRPEQGQGPTTLEI